MKFSAVIVFFGLLGSVFSYRESGQEAILSLINDECLGRLPNNYNDQNSGHYYQPVAYTLESFISLIEKIEHFNPGRSMLEITNMLLERFYFSEILFQDVGTGFGLSRDTNKIQRSRLLSKMMELMGTRFGTTDEVKEYFKRELTDNERCSLYFMIGHNINDTYRKEFDKVLPMENSQPDQTPGSNKVSVPHAQHPREQGLVTLHSDSVNAVAIGRVLVGIAAGQYKGHAKTFADLQASGDAEVLSKTIEILAGLTIGDAIAAAELTPKSNDGMSISKYGPPGSWNSSSCPTEYRLNNNRITTTDAEMRGSVDGYILGLHVSSLEGIKLSQLIRMYYSKQGITMDSNKNKIGFCQRSNSLGELMQDEETINNVIKYYRITTGKPASSQILWRPDYERYITNELSIARPKENICEAIKNPINVDDKMAEQPIDVFVVLDVTEHNTRGMKDQQIDVIGHLAGHLDIGNGAGSLTILTNSRIQLAESRELYNATNSGCVTCILERLANSQIFNVERDTVASTLEKLNRTLQDYEKARAHENGVPAKVVIFFHYDTKVNEDEKTLNDAIWQLHNRHRDVEIYAIGGGEILEKIASDQNTKYNTDSDSMLRALHLRKEFGKVPATLQYSECENRRYGSEEQHVFTGYVTPDEKQLWAMYPEYFLKSHNIEMKFRAENGKIRVCHDRAHSTDPSINANNDDNKHRCQEPENGGEIVFKISNPCKGRDVHNCEPFYFTVIGKPREQISGPSQCRDANCRRTDQIKFTVAHKGISCSGALGLLASPIMLVALVYTAARTFL